MRGKWTLAKNLDEAPNKAPSQAPPERWLFPAVRDIKRLRSLTRPISVTRLVTSTQAYWSALELTMLVDETEWLPSDPF